VKTAWTNTTGACSAISQISSSRYPDFSAKQARGMRNVLVHDYDVLDLERLWETATQDIPAIKRVVENYLQAHTDPS
jgi:uncharacterized protein with HEPN domain